MINKFINFDNSKVEGWKFLSEGCAQDYSMVKYYYEEVDKEGIVDIQEYSYKFLLKSLKDSGVSYEGVRFLPPDIINLAGVAPNSPVFITEHHDTYEIECRFEVNND